MRLSLGSTDVTPSGGTVTLIGRRSQGWQQVGPGIGLDEALDLLGQDVPVDLPSGPLRPAGSAPFLPVGTEITWHYRRSIDTARVVRDDSRGLVAWIPSGTAHLGAVPPSGGSTRDVALEERFSTAWSMRESTWRGPGVLRVAPTGRPWSLWFFHEEDGSYAGAYVNLELPHLRPSAADPIAGRTHTADLVLDVWVDAAPEGDEDIWLKDEDELAAAVAQGRFTARQGDAIRSLADHACVELLGEGSWPVEEGWQQWQPTADLDLPIPLPRNEITQWARGRSGRSALEG